MTHEILHTLGFDHCNSWQCVMNAVQTSDEFLFLSPVNLRKFKHLHGVLGDDTEFLINRYVSMKQALLRLGEAFEKDILWIDQKLQVMRAVCR